MSAVGVGPDRVEDPSVIDTHVHLWDLSHPKLVWNWVDTAEDHPILGRIDGIRSRAYDMEALVAETRFTPVRGFVHVQAAIGSADPVDETRWLAEQAAAHPSLLAIVAHADLGTDAADAQLDAHLQASGLVRGIRDFAVEPYLAAGGTDARMERSLARLAELDLVLDMDCEYPNMPAAAALARRHPDLTIVLEHLGFPRRRDAEYLAAWRAGISTLAAEPNVRCKISGIGMTDRMFTVDSVRPWIEHCLEAFGPQRCMLGSNWPLDRVCSSYEAVLQVDEACLSPLSERERRAVRSDVAVATYRLGQPHSSGPVD